MFCFIFFTFILFKFIIFYKKIKKLKNFQFIKKNIFLIKKLFISYLACISKIAGHFFLGSFFFWNFFKKLFQKSKNKEYKDLFFLISCHFHSPLEIKWSAVCSQISTKFNFFFSSFSKSRMQQIFIKGTFIKTMNHLSCLSHALTRMASSKFMLVCFINNRKLGLVKIVDLSMISPRFSKKIAHLSLQILNLIRILNK